MRPGWAAVLAFVGALAASAAPAAANPCADGGSPFPAALAPGGDEGGIGGTGLQNEAGGIGGTGRNHPDEGGLGGTGIEHDRAAVDDEGGISGTGIDQAAADTGIVGTITGFASICVGGTEIHYDAATPISIDGSPARIADLAVGQVVEVVARGSGTELRAAVIQAAPLVAGPVLAVDANHLIVAGQRVDVSATTWMDSVVAKQLDAIPLGSALQVYGLRRADGSIDASRLAPDPGAVVRLQGPVAATADSPNRVLIAGTPVELPNGFSVDVGAHLAVRGSWDDGVVRAADVQAQAASHWFERVTRVEIEAYARPVERGLDIGGIVVDAGVPEFQASYANQRVKLTAELDEARHLHVRTLVLARPRPAAPLRLDRAGPVSRSATTSIGPAPVDLDGVSEARRPPPQVHTGQRPPQRAAGGSVPRFARPPVARPPHLHRPPVPHRPPPRPDLPPRPR